jgi:mevalonate kinase
MGEHAVVYGRPALVAALDLRARVDVADADAPGVCIRLPQIGVDARFEPEAVLDYAREARERWERFAARPVPDTFRDVRGDDPAHLVKVALGETLERLGDTSTSVEVELDSKLPIGSGFGSSAAAAVALVGGMLAHRGRSLDAETIDGLAMRVEQRQHGLPSGVDHATSLRGGVVWARKSDGGTRVEEVTLGTGPLSRLRVYDSGPPAESTGMVVAGVRERLEALPERASATLESMERATRAMREQLSRERENADEVLEAMREYERCLEWLGAVPPRVIEIVRRVEAEGGAAKVSGAGSLSGDGAGGFLVYHPEPERLDGRDFLEPLRLHRVALGVDGLRIEA